MSNLYIYECSPIDDWSAWKPLNEWMKDSLADGRLTDEKIDTLHLRLGAARKALLHRGWDGDTDIGPYVSALPWSYDDYVIAWKQSDDGTTFLASPWSLHPLIAKFIVSIDDADASLRLDSFYYEDQRGPEPFIPGDCHKYAGAGEWACHCHLGVRYETSCLGKNDTTPEKHGGFLEIGFENKGGTIIRATINGEEKCDVENISIRFCGDDEVRGSVSALRFLYENTRHMIGE
ncbi:hypothetical protein [Methyloceanibacter caenitepidi]|uniref:Uncharacterized protein n=1 Tax=Methyloceanibacter caenitepidi TaxID=1384459 RepID=A0A0A8K599_9HYPH|nr:hypothetical protein [Methyloceanibacter caenitepidi]BAQ17931.1 hypothetical protein GL4_2497 [Methyloceanibacter caenitepidi]